MKTRQLQMFEEKSDFMTIKQISEALNVDNSTVRKIGKKLYPELFENGITTYFNQREVTFIKNEIGKGRTDLGNIAEVSNISTDIDMVNKTAEVIIWLTNKNKELTEKAALADAALRDDKEHYSITEAGKHLRIRQSDMFKILRSNGLLTIYNLPSQKAIDLNILFLRTNAVYGERNRPQSVMTMQNIDNFRKRYCVNEMV